MEESPKIYHLTKDEIQEIADRAARAALEGVGLQDDNAGSDIRDLRELLRSFRVVKSTALKTLVRNTVNFLFITLLLGLAFKTGLWAKG